MLKLLSGASDSAAVREDLQDNGHIATAWPADDGNLPHAPWILTVAGWSKMHDWLSTIKVPSAFGALPAFIMGKYKPKGAQLPRIFQFSLDFVT